MVVVAMVMIVVEVGGVITGGVGGGCENYLSILGFVSPCIIIYSNK